MTNYTNVAPRTGAAEDALAQSEETPPTRYRLRFLRAAEDAAAASAAKYAHVSIGRRRPHQHVTPAGEELVLVPLPRLAAFAIVERLEFERLLSLGVTDQWRTVDNDGASRHVVCNWRGRDVSVSRLIVGALPGRRVSYRDGNRFNLRRSNLVCKPGAATRRHDEAGMRAAVSPPRAPRPPRKPLCTKIDRGLLPMPGKPRRDPSPWGLANLVTDKPIK